MKLQWVLILAAIPHGYGRHDFFVPPQDRRQAGLLLFASQLPWSWAVALSKISIAFMLLRIKHTTQWKTFLYSMIVIQVLSAISANIVQFSICRPLSSIWDPFVLRADCWPPHVAKICIIVNGVIAIVTDIIFTLVPLTFIIQIKRPLREKIVVSLLMALGILASASSIVKLTLAKKYGRNRDRLYDGVDLAMWSIIEGEVAIIAACVPCLKSPSEKVLRRLGLLSSSKDSKCSDPKRQFGDEIGLSSLERTEDSLESLAGIDNAETERDILPIQRRRSSAMKDWDTDAVEKEWVKSFVRS